jgi:two-component system sensor histidine kinase CpxA
MKVSYPLSLKVSVWLLLNLVLLAAAAIGFFVIQGGLGWNALLSGPAGNRVQATANVIAGEAGSATTKEARNAVLVRLGAAYGAEYYLFRMDEGQIAGAPVDLPPEVKTHLEFWPSRMGGPGGPGGDFGRGFGGRRGGPRGGFDPGDRGEARREPPDGGRMPPPEAGRREGGPAPDMMGRGMGGPGSERGRFIVRTDAPTAYWVGLRVPFMAADRGRSFPIPAMMVARVGSLWGLLRLLDLQSWLLAATAVLVLSVLFWWPLIHGITRSLRQLTSATELIAGGRFDTRVPDARRDEIGKLGESVNRMAARLDTHMTGQKKFLGDVAHELCSPLARLQMATGILADSAPTHLKETVSDVREEVQQMSALVNELLLFTKAGMQPRDVVVQELELAPLVLAVLTREDAGRRVSADVPPELRVRGDAEMLARAFGNLVRNALRYAGESGPITLTATREADRVIVAVEDEGPGVPPEALDRLGEPFFRPEAARTRELGGVGLGLSIVRSSIAACGGETRFANREPQGFRAEVRLAAVSS